MTSPLRVKRKCLHCFPFLHVKFFFIKVIVSIISVKVVILSKRSATQKSTGNYAIDVVDSHGINSQSSPSIRFCNLALRPALAVVVPRPRTRNQQLHIESITPTNSILQDNKDDTVKYFIDFAFVFHLKAGRASHLNKKQNRIALIPSITRAILLFIT